MDCASLAGVASVHHRVAVEVARVEAVKKRALAADEILRDNRAAIHVVFGEGLQDAPRALAGFRVERSD